MPEQLFILANTVIMTASAAITVAIMVPVARAGQLRTNKLATATAMICVDQGRDGRLCICRVLATICAHRPVDGLKEVASG